MKRLLLIFFILAVSFFFRFNNLNWDSNFHLHPDERFLTMVGNSLKLPATFKEYFDQKISTLNPSNSGYGFFVYGRFPLILTKYLAVNLELDNYNDFTILGRQLSAFFDLLIVLLIFKTVLLLEKRYRFSSSIKYWASFFYGIAVLPIQLSHFFAVDTFLNFFMFGSFYCALKSSEARTSGFLMTLLSAIFFGLALACKVTALFILPLNLFFLFFPLLKNKNFKKLFLFSISYCLLTYIILRVADPYLFQSSDFFNPGLNTQFVESLRQLKSFESKDIWYPPAVQWIKKQPIVFSLTNLAIFGIGIPYFAVTIAGIAWIISKINSKFKTQNIKFELIAILIWVVLFFLYQSTQFVKTMRYFIFLYPFLAIFAGIGINYLLERIKNKNLFAICYLSFVILLLIWPLMFSSIYLHKHTRVEASEWIYKNLPSESIILGESWDDPLPLGVINNYEKRFIIDQLPVFDPDTPEKWQKMNEMLSKADYYVLSSNRGWGSIPTVPDKYPRMSQFYTKLLNNQLQYKKIKEFKPYYYKFFQLPNSWVDESFTVYDSPTVIILKNDQFYKKAL
jgi:hypothetical protein